jgi:hypothetical protein
MAYATLTDVVESLGRPIPVGSAEATQVGRWLANAELLIKSRIPDLDALITGGQIDQNAVVYAETEAVIRKIRNPDGKVSEDIDDYRYRLNTDAAKGSIFITDDEWSLIMPQELAPDVGAYSVQLWPPWSTA